MTDNTPLNDNELSMEARRAKGFHHTIHELADVLASAFNHPGMSEVTCVAASGYSNTIRMAIKVDE
jgi:hypothetical protein